MLLDVGRREMLGSGQYSIVMCSQYSLFKWADSEGYINFKSMSESLRELPTEYVESCPVIDEKYRVLFKLGLGRFSTVKMGIEMATNRRVAIKIMNYKIEEGEASRTEQEKVFAAFLNQIRMCLQAQHKSVVEILDFNVSGIYRTVEGKTHRVLYYVMKIARNGEVFRLVNVTDPFNERIARHLFKQLLRILRHLHMNRIAHCDIKSENILLGEHMRLKIADFGYARYLSDELGDRISYDSSEPVGTVKCNAPETYGGEYHADAIDLFASGCLLFELVVKSQPFKSAEAKDQYYHKLASDKKKFWDIYAGKCNPSADFKDLIEKILCADPKERLNLQQMLQHPWLAKEIATEQEYHKDMAFRIKKAMNRVKKDQQNQIKQAFSCLRERPKREIKPEQPEENPASVKRQHDQRVISLRQLLLAKTKHISPDSSSKSQDSEESDRTEEKVLSRPAKERERE